MARKSRKNIPEVVSSATVQTEVGKCDTYLYVKA